jgi:hypothetical protein
VISERSVLLFILLRFNAAVFRRGPELKDMNPEGESIKPGDEDEDGSKDIDTEDIDSDKTEDDKNEVEGKVEEH